MQSTEQPNGEDPELKKRQRDKIDRVNWMAVQIALQAMEKNMQTFAEQLQATQANLATLQAQFAQFQQQRVKELNIKVAGGSTTPEDMD